MDTSVEASVGRSPAGVLGSIWRGAGLILIGTLLVAWLMSTPEGLMGKADAIGYAVCHRIDLRSFHLGDRALPLCARCTGMHLGIVLSVVYLWARGRGRSGLYPSWPVAAVLAVFALAFVIDGLNSYLQFFPAAPHLYQPNNILRLITGLLLGISMGLFVYPTFNQSAWRQWREERVVRSMGDLVWLLVAAMGLAALVLTENPLILYPLALISTASVVALLVTMYAVIALLVMKRENRADNWRDLLLPLVIGFGVAMAQIGAIDWGRYLLTGTWNGIIF